MKIVLNFSKEKNLNENSFYAFVLCLDKKLSLIMVVYFIITKDVIS
jgi:hypothetical protein